MFTRNLFKKGQQLFKEMMYSQLGYFIYCLHTHVYSQMKDYTKSELYYTFQKYKNFHVL